MRPNFTYPYIASSHKTPMILHSHYTTRPVYSLRFRMLTSLSVLALAVSQVCNGQSLESPPTPLPSKFARILWQDTQSGSLRWANLERIGTQWDLKPKEIQGLPNLNTERQQFSQMQRLNDTLIVAVRDDAQGTLGSGWFAIDSGVILESHDDHYHAHFSLTPTLLESHIDEQQGNPAHVYRANGEVLLANDSKNGFTSIALADPSNPRKLTSNFFTGGGSHITLANCEHQLHLATWPDKEGQNAGRVDVVDRKSSPETNFQITLPKSGLHGAAYLNHLAFFAPSDGIIWFDTRDLSSKAAPALHHLPLGADPQSKRPYRTGAFNTMENLVLFQSGTEKQSFLGMINTATTPPSLNTLVIDPGQGLALSTPFCILAANGKKYAWIASHRKESGNQEMLTAVDLDPNNDGNTQDAIVHRTLPIGASAIRGHSGYHDVTFLPDGRTACISMPGDGEIWLVSVYGLEVLAKFPVGGTPTRLVSFGGVAHE